MYYFKNNAEFGVLVSLVETCVGSLGTFIAFLTLWVVCFHILFRLLGATFDEGTFEPDYDSDMNDYPKVPDIAVGLLQNFRNSIGDLSTPHYKYWEARYNGGEEFLSILMILIIWFLWVIEVCLMVIVLTNFLIALVSQIYE